MRPILFRQCLLFALFLLGLSSQNAAAQSFFSGVTSKTESLAPLPTDAEVKVAEEAAIEAAKPKPIIKTIIPQRAEQVGEDVFIILPREAPLPTGTISGGFFIEESGQAPAPVVSAPAVPAAPPTPAAPAVPASPPAPAQTTAVILDGKLYDKMPPEGAVVPEVVQSAAQLKQPAQKGVKPKAAPQKLKKSNPTTHHAEVTLSYEMDMALAEKETELFKLKDTLAGKKIKSVQVIANGEAPPLTDYDSLIKQRLKAIKAMLGIKKTVPTQIIILSDSSQQTLRVRVVYEAPAGVR